MNQRSIVCSVAPAPDDRREQLGWCFYDWACTAFSTSVISVFLGPYLTAIARTAADQQGRIKVLGIPLAAGAFFPAMVSLSVLLQLVCLPIIGAIADRSNHKKTLLGLYAYLGAAATLSLFLVQGSNYMLGGSLLLLGNVAFGAAIVVSNSFLPAIASPARRNLVSAQSWALGFLGGAILLALSLALYTQRDALGLTDGQAVRLCFLIAGLWWAIFTVIPLRLIKHRPPLRLRAAGLTYFAASLAQLRATLARARSYPQTLRFLLAYVLYADGIAAVLTLSSQFGSEELGLGQDVLLQAVLLVQVVGCGGALLFAKVAQHIGTKRTIMSTLLLWLGVIVYAYAFIAPHHPGQFYALATVIALVLGGTMALSRSLFSLLIPRGQEAEFFGLYEVCDHGTSWLAPLLFAVALQFTGSYRIALVSLVLFFLAGLVALARVDVQRGVEEIGNSLPPNL